MQNRERHFTDVIHVRVTPDLANAFKEAAARDDRTLSNWIRTNLKPLVENKGSQPERRRVAA